VAYISTRQVSGHKYYYLSESFREEGKAHPKQRVVAYLGRYQEAVVAIERMRHLPGEQKQNYLINLAKLEGRYSTEIPLQQKVYSALSRDPCIFGNRGEKTLAIHKL
jgi:hypothetical protein